MPFTLPPPPVAFTVDHVLLMRSDPSPPGNDYTELNRWTFGM
jgi:2'-5' RNA ligase